MSELTLFIGNKNYSSWSLTPWIFMRNNWIEFTGERIELFTKEAEQILKQRFSNPKVPILQDNDFEIWDSISILEYLAEKYPEANGWSENLEARATARSIKDHSGQIVLARLDGNTLKKISVITG